MNTINTSVAICGAGPAGLVLAHLLGEQGVDVVLIEKLERTLTEPRAIAIDGESLRTLQHIGLLNDFKSELLSELTVNYVNGEGVPLFQVGSPELQPYGYSTVNSFDQPALDEYLAENLKHRAGVKLHFSTTLERFEQDQNGVQIHCTDADNNDLKINADYLIGCDGGRSTIRSLLGIEMRGESNPQPWLVIDTIDPHLEDELDCQFFCDPIRPGMTMRKQHGKRRWEWMLMPGEDREFLLRDDNIRKIIAPYTDAPNVNIYRKRVYDFHAIMAERWQDGRVFLAGDAAHMTPPFAGQGLNSGFRDVTNLFWKLAAVIKGKASPDILTSYELERRDHAWELIETALTLGAQIQPIDTQQAAERDVFFTELNKDPIALQSLTDEMSAALLTRTVGKGLAIDGELDGPAGRLMIQPKVTSPSGSNLLLDEFLGTGFSIIGYDCDPENVLDSDTLAQWENMGTKVVSIYAENKSLDSNGLLDKKGELRDWSELNGAFVLLVRPDKFCMAAAPSASADAKLQSAYKLICGGPQI